MSQNAWGLRHPGLVMGKGGKTAFNVYLVHE
jgi:hypothetical protein